MVVNSPAQFSGSTYVIRLLLLTGFNKIDGMEQSAVITIKRCNVTSVRMQQMFQQVIANIGIR